MKAYKACTPNGGEKIKADTWYTVKNGQLVEAGEE